MNERELLREYGIVKVVGHYRRRPGGYGLVFVRAYYRASPGTGPLGEP